MNKTIYIIHGWDGSPNEPMHQWLKTKLEKTGIKVIIPAMPHAERPTIDDWIAKLKKVIKKPDKNTMLVGHSIGSQTILRYLEKLPPTKMIGGAVLIAPWLILSNLTGKEEKKIAEPWLKTKINGPNVTKRVQQIAAIFSADDPFVPLKNITLFKKRFGAKTITLTKKDTSLKMMGLLKYHKFLPPFFFC